MRKTDGRILVSAVLCCTARNQTGIGLFSPSDLKRIYERSAAQKCHLPIAFVVGSHPIDHVAATMRIPGDELQLLASLRGEPTHVVKCVTNDVRVPANSEYVLEGYLNSAGHKYPEGPFGEFLGYYGGVKYNPRFQSHGNNAAAGCGVPNVDHRRREFGEH